MDCGTDELPASGPQESAASDDEPLIKMKASLAAKSPEGKERKSSRSDDADKKADANMDNKPLIKVVRMSSKAAPNKSVDKKKQDSDDSSDDEPLIKMKSNGTNNKKTVSDPTTDSSDNEPLIKIAKVSSKAAKKSFSVPPKGCTDKKKRDSSAESDDSDDEPLSEIAKKLKAQRRKKAPVVSSKKGISVLKPKRNTARKIVTYAESSSNSSDDEPLATIKKKSTQAVQEQKRTADNKAKPKCTDRSLEDSLDKSSDDDVPLVNLIAKRKPLKKNTKTVSQGSASKKRQGVSDESSDDGPLINLIKKNQIDDQTTSKTKAPALKRRETPLKKSQKMSASGLSSNSSVGEPLTKSAKHPQVTKMVRIILERCDGEDAGPTGSFSKTKTESPIAEEITNEDTESSESSDNE